MEEVKKDAGQEPVKKPEVGVEIQQPIAPEVDPEVVISDLLAENKKLAVERENYRRAALKAKGKWHEPEPELVTIPEPVVKEENTEALEQLVSQAVSKLDTQFAESEKRLEEEAKRLARENKELKKSLANRSQVGSSAQGSSAVEQPVGDNSLSPEKIAELKKRGWNDKKIEAFKQNRFRR